MSDHLSNSSVMWDRNVGLNNADDGLNEAFAMMRQETKRLLARINTLEESLAKERKMKAGFKVIYDSIDLENKRLRNIISKKFKKHLENQRLESESEQTQHCKNLTLKGERSSTPQNDRRCPTPTQSSSTQTSPMFSLQVAGKSPHPFSERFCQSSCTSLRFPLQLTKHDFDIQGFTEEDTNTANTSTTQNRVEQELLDRIEELTERLRDSEEKLREADERSEMMAIQIETYKSDFMSERSDRENAMGRIMELERELASLRRKLEDHNHYQHQHPLSCRLGPLCTQESFQIPSYQSSPPKGTSLEDILVARGPCQETEEPERALEFDWDPCDDRGEKLHSLVDLSERQPKKNLSSSLESLDLLPTEHGGDDYYR